MTASHVFSRRALALAALATAVVGAPPAMASSVEDPTTSTTSSTTTAATTSTTVPAPPPPPPVILPTPPPGADGRSRDGRIVGISDALASVPATGDETERAASEHDRIAAGLADARRRIDDAANETQRLADETAAIDETTRREFVHHSKLVNARAALVSDMRHLAVERYVNGREDALLPPSGLSLDESMDRSQIATMAVEASRGTAAAVVRVDSQLAESDRQQASLVARRSDDVTRSKSTETDRAAAETDAFQYALALPAAEQTARDARLLGFVAGSDLPLIALDAYWRAALRERLVDPTCGLTWWALAGIGRTESNHGRQAGGMAGSGGVATRPIIGIALNGSGGTTAIPDTDHGLLDGDPVWDRAIGPMQFIPGTWAHFGIDVSGDGVADPQNIYDSAAAAAVYICRYGPGLDADPGLQRAYYSYNHSASYVALVLQRAHDYEALPVPSLTPPASPPVAPPPG